MSAASVAFCLQSPRGAADSRQSSLDVRPRHYTKMHPHRQRVVKRIYRVSFPNFGPLIFQGWELLLSSQRLQEPLFKICSAGICNLRGKCPRDVQIRLSSEPPRCVLIPSTNQKWSKSSVYSRKDCENERGPRFDSQRRNRGCPGPGVGKRAGEEGKGRSSCESHQLLLERSRWVRTLQSAKVRRSERF